MSATVIALLIAADFVKPPIHRAWTALTGDRTVVYAVKNQRIYYSAQKAAGALSLDGKPLWKHSVEWTRDGAIGPRDLFILVSRDKNSELQAFNLATGTAKTLVKLPGECSAIACDSTRVFVLKGEPKVEAFDQRTGRSLWKRDLRPGKPGRTGLAGFSFGSGRLFAGVDGAGLNCIDPVTGKVLWKANAKYGVYEPPIFLKDGIIKRRDVLQKLALGTGKPIWTAKTDYFQPLSVVGKVLIGMDGGRRLGIDTNTGKTLWADPPPKDSSVKIGGNDVLAPAGPTSTIIAEDELMEVAFDGKVRWRIKPPFMGSPVFADDNLILVNDNERLLAYRHGQSDLPSRAKANPEAVAKQLVANYEALDETEKETVKQLRAYATEPLIAKFVEWAIANEEGGSARKEGRGQMLYGLLTDTPSLLLDMVQPSNTDALLMALKKIGPKNSYRGALVAILGEKGDSSKAIPVFVEQLRSAQSSGRGGETLRAVAASKNPLAVQYMIDILADPSAPAEWRREAFIHLPGTGGQRGIDAVRIARARRMSRPTWQEEMAQEKDREKPIAEGADPTAKVWRLRQSSVLGNHNDVFLEEKTESGWNSPIFIGLFLSNTWTEKAPTTYRGIPVSNFIKSDWLKILPGDEAIRKDSDHDGLTDLVEERLGTNLNQADSDGDGLNDAVDPCPNAAPRELSDREKILAAAVEARFFASGWSTPALISAEHVQPFEMYGYNRPLLWESDAYKGTLRSMYNNGVNTISFHAYIEDMRSSIDGKDWLSISSDGSSAKTTIRRYSGVEDGDASAVWLIKSGDEWFITDMQVRYVS